MKNREHSELAKRLYSLRKQYSWYYNGININKENISLHSFDLWSGQSLRSLIRDLEDKKYMVREIQNEIKEVKNQIYLSQREYSINHANQQPSQPLTKLEGSETNS